MANNIITRNGDLNEGPGSRPPRPPTVPPKKPLPSHGNLGGSPGLITSTGGLYGDKKALLIPFYDTKNKNNSLQILDSDNFNTEEDGFYYFPSPDISIARAVTISQVAVIYREIGVAQFTVGIIVYVKKLDMFIFKEKTLNINDLTSPKTDTINLGFPDNKLHTVYADLNITGERPQVYIKRLADSGPLCIQSVTLAGHRDTPQLM